MLKKAITRLLALLTLLPASLIAAPVVMTIDLKWGRGNPAARKAQRAAMTQSKSIRPFMWAHRVLFCNGDARRQRW